MTEEGKITMSEFKTVVERFEDNQKKIIEVMNHRFDKVETDMHAIKEDVSSLKEEVALLHEGQTAIRADLRRKVSYDDFEMLEKRVARIE
ncbi:hypothetical protein KAR34_00170 [bacterium]|nr:hypothetical protein [bacterium]